MTTPEVCRVDANNGAPAKVRRVARIAAHVHHFRVDDPPLRMYRGTSLIRNSPPPLGRLQDPRYSLTVGSDKGGVSYERGTSVAVVRGLGVMSLSEYGTIMSVKHDHGIALCHVSGESL